MGTMGTMGTMVLQNTVDKLIKKTNLATVIGTHSWREQFLEAITVSAGASPRHRTGGAPNRGDTHHGDTQLWGHPTMGDTHHGDTQLWGTPIMGTPNRGDTQLWGTPNYGDTQLWGTPNRGDTQPWGPSPGGHALPHGGHSGVDGDPLGSAHIPLPHLMTLGSPHALSPIQVTLRDQWGPLGVIPCPFFCPW